MRGGATRGGGTEDLKAVPSDAKTRPTVARCREGASGLAIQHHPGFGGVGGTGHRPKTHPPQLVCWCYSTVCAAELRSVSERRKSGLSAKTSTPILRFRAFRPWSQACQRCPADPKNEGLTPTPHARSRDTKVGRRCRPPAANRRRRPTPLPEEHTSTTSRLPSSSPWPHSARRPPKRQKLRHVAWPPSMSARAALRHALSAPEGGGATACFSTANALHGSSTPSRSMHGHPLTRASPDSSIRTALRIRDSSPAAILPSL